MKKRTIRRTCTCRASFLALEKEVREAIRNGHTLRAIHAQRKERLAMSYQSFARYVQMYLKGVQTRQEGAAAPPPLAVLKTHPGTPLKVTAGPVLAQRMHDATGQHDETLV